MGLADEESLNPAEPHRMSARQNGAPPNVRSLTSNAFVYAPRNPISDIHPGSAPVDGSGASLPAQAEDTHPGSVRQQGHSTPLRPHILRPHQFLHT